jgi:hypothetical protein
VSNILVQGDSSILATTTIPGILASPTIPGILATPTVPVFLATKTKTYSVMATTAVPGILATTTITGTMGTPQQFLVTSTFQERSVYSRKYRARNFLYKCVLTHIQIQIYTFKNLF